jgi:hypothetical protein
MTSIDFDIVREIALSFPHVQEGDSAGMPTFYARSRRFLARLHDKGDLLILKVGKLEMEFLLEAEPDIYQTTEHYQRWEEVLIQMSRISEAEFRHVFEKAWRRLAQKRDVAEYDKEAIKR